MCDAKPKPAATRHLLASEFTTILVISADASEASSVEIDLKVNL
jgi:hypothetical protein